jgi:hypothetical protein
MTNIQNIFDENDSLLGIFVKSMINLDDRTFISDDNANLQIGVFNYKKPHKIKKHKHNIIERKVDRTQEFLMVLSGEMEANIYSDEGTFICNLSLTEGSGLFLLAGWHDFVIPESCNFMEAKTGPYLGFVDKISEDDF